MRLWTTQLAKCNNVWKVKVYRLNAVPRSVIYTKFVNMMRYYAILTRPGSWLHFLLFPWRGHSHLGRCQTWQVIKSYYNTVDGRNAAKQLRLVFHPNIYRVLYVPGGSTVYILRTCQVHNQHECSQWCSQDAKTCTDWPVSWLCTASLLSPLCHFRQDTITWITTQGCLLYFC